MGKVLFDLSMSLDGFIAGPGVSLKSPLGEGGVRIHQWMIDLSVWREHQGLTGGQTNQDSEVVDEIDQATGAFVMGRRMFDTGEEPWGPNPPFRKPVFVVTHHARETLVREGGTTFTFVTDGPESALKQAREAAGEKAVRVAGGADIAQQYLRAGLLDEIQIHVAPVFLAEGVRLFEQIPAHLKLESTRVIASPGVTHLRFRIVR